MADFTLTRNAAGREMTILVRSWGMFNSIRVRGIEPNSLDDLLLQERPANRTNDGIVLDGDDASSLKRAPAPQDDDIDFGLGGDDAEPSPPKSRLKRKVVIPDDSDDDEFDESLYNMHGRREQRELAHNLDAARVTARQAFDWYIEYVVRAAYSRKWEETATKGGPWEHMFSRPVERIWDQHGLLCDSLVTSQSWGKSVPRNEWTSAEAPNIRSAADESPYMLVRTMERPVRGVCEACQRKRLITSRIELFGAHHTTSCGTLDEQMMKVRLERTCGKRDDVRQWKVGPKCSERLEAYHAARHWLWDLLCTIAGEEKDTADQVLTDDFRQRVWEQSECVLNDCRKYASESERSVRVARRYGRKDDPDGMDGEELTDDE